MKAGAILEGIYSLSNIFVWMCFYFLNIKGQANEFLGSETEFRYHVLLEEEHLCCVQDVATSVLVNFLKIYKSDRINILMPQKY